MERLNIRLSGYFNIKGGLNIMTGLKEGAAQMKKGGEGLK